MGEVLQFIDKGAAKFVRQTISAKSLVFGRDFEVVSFVVVDKDNCLYTLGSYIGKTSNDLFAGQAKDFAACAKDQINGSGAARLIPTPYPKNPEHVEFYQLSCDIDIDLAVEMGLGVVKYGEKFAIYCPKPIVDPIEIIYEVFRLNLYIQLLNPDNIDQKLKEGFHRNKDLIESIFLLNTDKHMMRLEDIFK